MPAEVAVWAIFLCIARLRRGRLAHKTLGDVRSRPYRPNRVAKALRPSAEGRVTPFLAPYYLTIFAVLGGVTTAFVVVIVLLMVCTANVNLLGWVE